MPAPVLVRARLFAAAPLAVTPPMVPATTRVPVVPYVSVPELVIVKVASVPLSPIHTIAEAMADPQAAARNLIWDMGNKLRLIANPLQHMSRTPARPASFPPELGADTASVLRDNLGLSADDLATLTQDGVVSVRE